jgi:hypothetical protein
MVADNKKAWIARLLKVLNPLATQNNSSSFRRENSATLQWTAPFIRPKYSNVGKYRHRYL